MRQFISLAASKLSGYSEPASLPGCGTRFISLMILEHYRL